MIAITEFAAGAMENWGLVTYRVVDLLIDADSASSKQKQRVCEVVAHELAHQWFGNLVTMNWWDDLWLNEGFAAWMQKFAVITGCLSACFKPLSYVVRRLGLSICSSASLTYSHTHYHLYLLL